MMDAKLENKLVEKYKDFFDYLDEQQTPMINPNKSMEENISLLIKQEKIVVPMQFGIECGNGWFWLLDHLMNSIKWHLEQENQNQDDRPKYKQLNDISWKLKHSKIFLFKKIGKFLCKYQPKGLPHITFRIDQIKEKYGGLRYYYSGGDDIIDGMVNLAESLSYDICENCGTTHNVGHTRGWIYTICELCREKNDRAKELEWNLNK